MGQFLPHRHLFLFPGWVHAPTCWHSVAVTFSLLSQDSSVCFKGRDTLLPLPPPVHRNSAGSGTSLEGQSTILSWCCQTLGLQGLELTALPAHPVSFLSPSVQSNEK